MASAYWIVMKRENGGCSAHLKRFDSDEAAIAEAARIGDEDLSIRSIDIWERNRPLKRFNRQRPAKDAA